jgi:hypothetical protein
MCPSIGGVVVRSFAKGALSIGRPAITTELISTINAIRSPLTPRQPC